MITRVLDSPIGQLVAGADADGIVCLEFADGGARLERQLARVRAGGPPASRADPLNLLELELAEYFAGTRREFTVRLAPQGTPFQHQVWAALLRIPYGATTSYGALARALGRPGGQRAVGLANGRNPISIIIPCHRVIEAGGGLRGYGGGLWRKRFLLDLERRVARPDELADTPLGGGLPRDR